MIEFTGERVVPGQVDVDLWNEHLARYAFAARLAAGKRVLDAGCGTGYGCAALAEGASSVTGLDIAPEAIAHAREHSAPPGVTFLEGSCSAMPLPDATFDLVIAFEVIEHLEDWHAFLLESRRVLAPGGIFLLSTPNRDYYAEARSVSGPNPFHVHEFSFDEFGAALGALFPHVHLYLQNHVEGIAFQPAPANGHGLPELQQAGSAPDPHDAHFFLAACSAEPQPALAPFVYVPTTANVLRERERHIAKLEIDVNQLREDKEKLVEMFRIQKAALEEANHWSSSLDGQLAAASARIVELQVEDRTKTEWAQQLDEKLNAASARIVQLQNELEQTSHGFQAQVTALERENDAKTEWTRQLDEKLGAASARIAEMENELEQTAVGYRATEVSHSRLQELERAVAVYAAQVAQVEAENDAKTGWARRLEADLEAKGKDLVHCVEVLHATEKTLEERTARMLQLEERVNCATASRWVKLGNLLGLGPRLNGE